MKEEYFLAIDIGASSGRHVLAWRKDDGVNMEEIFRFSHHPVSTENGLVWDIKEMQNNILTGLKKCKILGKIPCGVGIDTFGVDYALVDSKGDLIGEVYSYRNLRTISSQIAFNKQFSEIKQFQRTGIQPQIYNTVYQLMADRMSGKLDRADQIMLLPSYLSFFLTGVRHNEFTIASTTGLLQTENRYWDSQLLNVLGINQAKFAPLVMPGTSIGPLSPKFRDEVGYDATVYAIGAHDTASAVLGSLADDNTAFLSSGTWSLLGMLSNTAFSTEDARVAGFTNEGAVGGKIRFLKNIMGLWMIQEIRRELSPSMPYSEITELAATNRHYNGIVDVTDQRFLSPVSMKEAVLQALRENSYPDPSCPGELYYAVFRSLAIEYGKTITKLESFRKRPFGALNVIGGGSQNRLLNELTAEYTGKDIIAGPSEATALGNILAQMIAKGVIQGTEDIKSCVRANIQRPKKG